jgi:hypothetical protein
MRTVEAALHTDLLHSLEKDFADIGLVLPWYRSSIAGI